ncbi:MAG: STAS domain-containing protein [Steroidobacteraceae bacterium]
MAVDLARARARDGQARFAIVETSPGRYEAQGPLTFATARRALDAGIGALAAARDSALEVSCAGVGVSDSAGLAVLIEWRAWARRNGRELALTHVPAAVRAIARICEIEELLLGAERPS